MFPDEPKGWRTLWLRAQRERDPKKLVELIDQLNQLLAQEERRAAAEVRHQDKTNNPPE
jgi:hypothetical protein